MGSLRSLAAKSPFSTRRWFLMPSSASSPLRPLRLAECRPFGAAHEHERRGLGIGEGLQGRFVELSAAR